MISGQIYNAADAELVREREARCFYLLNIEEFAGDIAIRAIFINYAQLRRRYLDRAAFFCDYGQHLPGVVF